MLLTHIFFVAAAALFAVLFFRSLRSGKANWYGFVAERYDEPAGFWSLVVVDVVVFCLLVFAALH